MNDFDPNTNDPASTNVSSDASPSPGPNTVGTNPYYQQPLPQYIYIQPTPIHIASLVLGILSLCLFWLGIGGLILGIIGVALAVKAKKNNFNSQVGFGLSLAGMIIGIFLTGFLIVLPFLS